MSSAWRQLPCWDPSSLDWPRREAADCLRGNVMLFMFYKLFMLPRFAPRSRLDLRVEGLRRLFLGRRPVASAGPSGPSTYSTVANFYVSLLNYGPLKLPLNERSRGCMKKPSLVPAPPDRGLLPFLIFFLALNSVTATSCCDETGIVYWSL